MKDTIFKQLSDSINLPSLIQIDANLIVASFPIMKLLPAKYVLEKAVRENRVSKNGVVAETSSGTYALGLAMICAELKRRFHIVSDAVIDLELRQQLEHLGGEVQIVEDKAGEGLQVARLKALNGYLSENSNAYWPQQYDNPEHLYAYFPFADLLIKNIGPEFTLVASCGSGSSSTGTIMRLREYNPKISLVGVDTFGSTLFGLQNGKRALRGLGNSIMPKNLKHAFFDQVHWVSANQAFHAAKELYSTHSLYGGPTTGACYQVARWIAKENPKEKVVFISADSGYRYASTVYNENWMRENQYFRMAVEPILAKRIDEMNAPSLEWGYIQWNRSSLNKMLNG